MGGVLTHLAASLVGFLIAFIIFKKYKYGGSFVVGQLIPDTIKFGIPGIMFKTSSFNEIISKPLFWTLNTYTHSFWFWLVICIIAGAITFALYKMKKIKKETFKTWLKMNIIFLVAIAIHLIIDAYVVEKSYWI